MPRLKDRNPYDGLTKALLGARAYEGITTEEIARYIGVSEPTALKYIRRPELAPLGMVLGIGKKLHIPIEVLRERIPG